VGASLSNQLDVPEPGHSDKDHLIGFTGTSCSEPGSGCASPIQRPEWCAADRAELPPDTDPIAQTPLKEDLEFCGQTAPLFFYENGFVDFFPPFLTNCFEN
jgi:hypothetical protein